MKLRKLFEKAQMAITFAEAGLFDEAREIMGREAEGREVPTPTAGSKWAAGDENLHSAPAGS